ncbi:MAG TPA: glycosyltransferase [Rickettsiales bacterium]|nr:glycosyltransferase [Rickettsiales bacterium]
MSGQRVSVVVPVYNVVTFLQEAIDSVFAQDYPDIELVVVNDGSNTMASEEIARICTADARITLINQKNTGQAVARRNGALRATGDYIWFLDGDDALIPGAVSHLVAALEANPSAVASYGKKIFLENGTFKYREILPLESQSVSGDILPALLEGIPLLSNGSVCIRREYALKIRFPEGIRQGEDWITWCRLAAMGDIICAGHRPVLSVRQHNASTSRGVFTQPSILFSMLAVVYGDPELIARIGREKLQHYRMEHTRRIHEYLRVSYTERKQYVRARWHAWLSAHWQRKRAKQQFPPRDNRIRVLHVVKWFYAGGAERLISSVLQHSDRERYDHVILSLSDQKERLAEIQNTLGIPYIAVEITRDKWNIAGYLRCLWLIIHAKPDVIKTWLPPSNIAGGIVGWLLRIPVIWGIHNALPPETKDAFRQVRFSRFMPARIICCSQAVYDTCVTAGHDVRKLEIITNGTDTAMFCHSPQGRARIRKELGIAPDTLLIGMAAEFVPIKRHPNFLVAAHMLLKSYPQAQFLLCGKDTTRDNLALRKYICTLGMEEQVYLLGIRNDMADIYNALDIHVLNSHCESFGLAVAEAVSCETLCVATEVGIMKQLLQDVGELIPVSEDPAVLAEALKRIIKWTPQEKAERRAKGRKRMMRDYSVSETARQYDALYLRVMQQRKNKQSSEEGTAFKPYNKITGKTRMNG